jgi:hypothetical protein
MFGVEFFSVLSLFSGRGLASYLSYIYLLFINERLFKPFFSFTNNGEELIEHQVILPFWIRFNRLFLYLGCATELNLLEMLGFDY